MKTETIETIDRLSEILQITPQETLDTIRKIEMDWSVTLLPMTVQWVPDHCVQEIKTLTLASGETFRFGDEDLGEDPSHTQSPQSKKHTVKSIIRDLVGQIGE